MTNREQEIIKVATQWSDERELSSPTECARAFIAGAEWADKNPDKKLVHTKQELYDMGFAFDLNGNIATPQEMEEATKGYLLYLKSQWIDKACEWLKEQEEMVGISFQDDFYERFKKAMED